MVVLSSRSGRNLLLPVLGGFGTSRDGTQQIRSFPKPMLFFWDVFLFPSLQFKFLNTSLGRKSMLTHRALSFLRAFYPPKWWSSRSLEEQPARPSTPPCRAPRVGPTALHLHLPQVVSIACSPDVWKPRLVTPDWFQRETWAGRKQFE